MSPPRRRPRLAAPVALLLGVAVSAPRPALADPTLADKAAAEALFEDALQLMGAKRFGEACPKLEESERLDPALGTRFRLAECDEAIGRLASAWAGYVEVADLAHTAGQIDREALARSRAAALEPRLPRVKLVVVQPDTPGLELASGSSVIGRGRWGSPVPIDPGVYTVTATAPGKKAWRGSVTVAADGSTATLTVPVLDDAAPPPAPVEARASSAWSTGRVAGAAVGGGGVVAVGMSVVLGFVAKSKYDGAGANCGATACDASGKATTDSARQLADVATGVFVVGVTAAVAGVAIFVAFPGSASSAAPGAPGRTGLRIGPGSAFVEGVF